MGKFKAGEENYFFTSLPGSFSKTQVELALRKMLSLPILGEISIRKGYKALFYPEGKVLGFQDGALLKTNSSNYFIVSQGKTREFRDRNLVFTLGLDPENFWEVNQEELALNLEGEKITSDKEGYPENSLFKIGNDFFMQSEGGVLKKFLSLEAFLSRYPETWTVEKKPDFLVGKILSEEAVGFSDGSLLSYGESVFVVSGKKLFPIDNFVTFEAFGYNWDDVIPVSGDEISFYEKQKLMNLSSPHPSGTIFYSLEKDLYFLIEEDEKRPLGSFQIASSWLKKSPIIFDSESLELNEKCQVKKKRFSLKKYFCQAEISKLEALKGKDYEFRFVAKEDFRTDELKVKLRKDYSLKNLNNNFREILSSIKKNYATQNNPQ